MLKRFLPDSLFGQLAWLLAAVALVSHALALSLMFELRPPPPPPLPALHASDHRPLAPPTEKILLDIAVRLGAVLFAAWFGARWLSAPVQRLANATRELAENIHRPPLAEEGSRECREATGVINQLQRHILDQLQERDQFVAAVSHDLRTPLTRMALKVESLPNEIDRQRFKKNIEDMDHMIKATLGYLQGVASPEEADNLDLKSLLQSVVHDYQETHQKVELRN
jgi:signal transduction histidine kinase